MKKVPTGIKGFDSLVKGGFTAGDNIVVAGTPGTGKTIFSSQFIHNGIKIYGDPGVYVSTEEKKDRFFRNMLNFGMDFEELEKSGKFRYVEQVIGTSELYDVDRVVEAAHEISAKRIVFDSLNMFAARFPSENERMVKIFEYMGILSKDGKVVLWVEEMPDEGDIEFKPPHFLADGMVLIKHLITKSKNARMLSVIKLRGVGHDDRLHPVQITDNGLIVYAEEVPD